MVDGGMSHGFFESQKCIMVQQRGYLKPTCEFYGGIYRIGAFI